MKRVPPRPFLRSLVLTAVVVWIVPRAIMTSGVRVASAVSGVSMEVRPMIRLGLALAVSGVVLLDVTVSRERVFMENLGVSPVAILGIGFGAAMLCEIALEVVAALSALAGIGG